MYKRSLTLIELIISLGLLSLLLSTLFFGYRFLSLEKSENRSFKHTLLQEQALYQRLDHLFSRVDASFFASISSQSVAFHFDRGLCSQSELSNLVLGALYYDSKSQSLSLGIWPKDKIFPRETALLLENISSMVISYYYPPDPLKKVDPTKVSTLKPQVGWQTLWREEYKTLPFQIQFVMKRITSDPHYPREVVWVFDLNQSPLVLTT